MEEKTRCDCRAKRPWWARQVTQLVDVFLMTGVALAIAISWEKYHSVGYSTFTAFMGWFYVMFPSVHDKAWMG